MKTTNLKWIVYALSALMLMSSCRVYHSKTSTVDEVVMSKNMVLAKNYNGDKYKFKYLFKENNKIYGIANGTIKTARLLSENIVEDNIEGGIDVKILIPSDQIKEYHIKNNTLSTILTIGIPIVIGLSFLSAYWFD